VLKRVAHSFDRLVSKTVLKRSGRTQAEIVLGAEGRAVALRRAMKQYGDPDLILRPETFFGTSAPAEIERHPVRDGVFDLTWSSEYQPFNVEIGSDYLSRERNCTCAARLIRTRRASRGTVILLHGYLGGRFALEERIWPIAWFLDRGFNCALFTLPFHGLRGTSALQPGFPGSDPRVTIEGFRQAIHDLRGLIAWLEREHLGPSGAIGMSLGGYTSALLATIEPRLAFVVPYVPLASIARFAMDRGRFIGSEAQQQEQHRLVDQIYRVVSPLARPVLVPRPGRLVVAGRADAITPLHHAEMIATHFEAPLETFAGGHLMQLGRGRAFDRIGKLLEAIRSS
jgi:pimeloyl-ACP methyl ester carboxylesterase